MKLQKLMVQFSCLFFISIFLCSCVPDKTETNVQLPDAPPVLVEQVEKHYQLPVQYQRPSYMVDSGNADNLDEIVDDVAIKVGASIRSTQGPQPLWDILKRLAALKKMSVSWASDVDQNVLVDVDISANDDFYSAIENLLRQVDFYHEMNGSTIVVRYKETRQFHVAMPFTKQLYETAVGGNVLGSTEEASNIEGTIRLDSRGNEFDIWKNIQDNMDAILDTWSTTATTATLASESTTANEENQRTETTAISRQISASGNKYTIDKPIGLITVHAPRPLLNKLDVYFKNLTKELYKQISIEAKIIEVQLNDRSSIGLNWNLLLENLSVATGFASANKTRNKTVTDSSTTTDNTWSAFSGNYRPTFGGDSNSIVSAATIITNGVTEGAGGLISLSAFTFDTFLNAVKQQGQTTILSNPKLSVLNGQPALITVGRNVTYIDNIESDVNNETGTISYTVNTERVLSGVGMALTANILNDNEVVLNLVPVISELVEPIEYRTVGLGEVGLPIINVREMSTTVKIKDGEMLVIGGLISNVEEEDGTFVPGTSNIPFFKYFFGYEEKISRKRELIILLKPSII
ncbi:type II and III secretion system protein [Desulfocapsa sp. AH-315-G09]|nr:type II and III secretion system protein [Desulfocapsa sp.]MBN4065562.1 type II and III secretion system protein [Desulfocapsa sp. AH-315-G09]